MGSEMCIRDRDNVVTTSGLEHSNIDLADNYVSEARIVSVSSLQTLFSSCLRTRREAMI